MRKSRFNEEQTIAIPKESEVGVETGELGRRHGITKASFYRWKSKYGGLELSEAKRLKHLEEENRQPKHNCGRANGGHPGVEGGAGKKVVSPRCSSRTTEADRHIRSALRRKNAFLPT